MTAQVAQRAQAAPGRRHQGPAAVRHGHPDRHDRPRRGQGGLVIACHPVRDLLVGCLRERQPALDYYSLDALSYYLAKLFWSDLERHPPCIDGPHLPTDVADAW